ncbi:GUN4 domain-containing protein [Microcoleus sp. D2_18a_B4]|uniref:GUN4 domain-containing protein n=1 Tax=Microcoleus sp. D2_18a_B4 TaxID=3055329 RepID=UPI002FCEFB12
MGRNLAISIGINNYEFLTDLKYAKRDAELMREFFRGANFEQVFFLSDDWRPDTNGKWSRASIAHLRDIVMTKFEEPFMSNGDNFWFFFSGHGRRHDESDYLMACDSNPRDIEHTGIRIDFLTERLRRCGADNVILILDACRDLGSKSGEGIGNQTTQIAREKGVVTFFSCSPNQLSYEIDALKQGAFTRAVLDGLGPQGQCATVEQLDRYLSDRVPELILEHKGEKVQQTPRCIAAPPTKSHLIIFPQYAIPYDIIRLKNDALQAEFINKNYDLAEQLWIRVLAASPGNRDAINGIKRIAVKQIENERYSQDNSVSKIDNPVSAIEIVDEEENLVSEFDLSEEEEAIGDFDMDDDEEAAVSDFDMADDDEEEAVSDFDMADDDEEEATVSNSNAKRSESLLSPKSTPVVNPIPTTPDVPLRSEKGVDYTNLRDLLANGKWKEADEETTKKMLKAAGGGHKYTKDFPKDQAPAGENLLKDDDIYTFPCEDLRTIDQLWVKYSNGRFGFSVQKRIYESLGGTRKYDLEICEAFGDRVGWLVNSKWLNYDDLKFNTKAIAGQLPSFTYSFLTTLSVELERGDGSRTDIVPIGDYYDWPNYRMQCALSNDWTIRGILVSSLASRLVDCNI